MLNVVTATPFLLSLMERANLKDKSILEFLKGDPKYTPLIQWLTFFSAEMTSSQLSFR